MSDTLETVQFDSPAAFRAWLTAHHDVSSGVWVSVAKKGSRTATLSYAEAVAVALAHGWIDSQARRFDDATFLQRFTPRRPHSPWSARNRRAAEAMIESGTMTPAGLAEVERARADGRW